MSRSALTRRAHLRANGSSKAFGAAERRALLKRRGKTYGSVGRTTLVQRDPKFVRLKYKRKATPHTGKARVLSYRRSYRRRR